MIIIAKVAVTPSRNYARYLKKMSRLAALFVLLWKPVVRLLDVLFRELLADRPDLTVLLPEAAAVPALVEASNFQTGQFER